MDKVIKVVDEYDFMNLILVFDSILSSNVSETILLPQDEEQKKEGQYVRYDIKGTIIRIELKEQ